MLLIMMTHLVASDCCCLFRSISLHNMSTGTLFCLFGALLFLVHVSQTRYEFCHRELWNQRLRRLPVSLFCRDSRKNIAFCCICEYLDDREQHADNYNSNNHTILLLAITHVTQRIVPDFEIRIIYRTATFGPSSPSCHTATK
jgi:hypothetical protein